MSSFWKRTLLTMQILTVLLLLLGGWTAYYLYQLHQQLPSDLVKLEHPDYSLPTVLYDRNGAQIGEFYIQRRIVVSYDKFPAHLIQALIASEDGRFFYHWGFDPVRVMQALFVNLKAMRVVQGASTLTQQTARLFLLTPEKKLVRKLKELLLALRIEMQFSKEEILTLYLNKAFLGNAEGVEASAQGYFGKHTSELTLGESALLVGILPAPSLYSPAVNPERAIKRRNLVLKRMLDSGFISPAEYENATLEPLKIRKTYDAASPATAYYVEHVRQYLIKKYGADELYNGGLKVHLAMDLDKQISAHNALREGILEVSQRLGFRGAMETIPADESGVLPKEQIQWVTQKNRLLLGGTVKGVVQKVSPKDVMVNVGNQRALIEWDTLKKWKSRQKKSSLTIKKPADLLKKGDVIWVKLKDWDAQKKQFAATLYQKPEVNGGILALDPKTGEALAMVGGYSYRDSKFNRAVQGLRQPGSAFKAIVYALALESGYQLSSMLVDSPRLYKEQKAQGNEQANVWTPKNYGNKLLGAVRLKSALAKSLNLPTIGLVEDLGIDRVIDYSRRLGITSPMPKDLTIALGSHSLKLAELVRAYNVFANSGKLTDTTYILKIENSQGDLLEEAQPHVEQVISEETSFLVTEALKEVVQHGTGRRVRRAIPRISAGKTGTTNSYVDAWYIGYIPQLLTGVYVGFDQPRSMGRTGTGSGAAVPIWLKFMKHAIKSYPRESFRQPQSIISLKIHKSGRRAVPCDPPEDVYYELFRKNQIPPLNYQSSSDCASPLAKPQSTEAIEW